MKLPRNDENLVLKIVLQGRLYAEGRLNSPQTVRRLAPARRKTSTLVNRNSGAMAARNAAGKIEWFGQLKVIENSTFR